jgi:hypothetical protein
MDALSDLEREWFATYLVKNYSETPVSVEGFQPWHYIDAMFSGPDAYREALSYVLKRGNR